jgi:hypothetical protein
MPRTTATRSGRVTLSVGGACCDSFGTAAALVGAVPDDLISAAEIALKNVKASGDDGTRFFIANLRDPQAVHPREIISAHATASPPAS